ncbi:cytochrome P450 [Ganoderma sinense ZZ0214-1]|uniref:Cytochrome P450 n=1 Tax=Ganoderma sinense ZZ0214-1 TaxID=1077348 RepID=A0A2G8S9M4_9APHY|nr:cytochrome P450 [Ganoderma sinense ZZ0214-1]
MDDFRVAAAACAMMAIVLVYAVRWYTDPLRAIPTVGGTSLPGLSYLTARRTNRDFKALLEEGYRKYPGSMFKLAFFTHWLVILSGPELVEEVRKRPDEELSLMWAHAELIWQSNYTLEPQLSSDRYHVQIVREKLTRRLATMLPDILDEVAVALDEGFGTDTKEWTEVAVTPLMNKVTVRAINRSFVGLPLCRNEEYLSLVAEFTQQIVQDGATLRLVPKLIRSFIAPFIIKAKKIAGRAVTYLRPVVEQRMSALAELGDDQKESQKPNDLLQFILDTAVQKGEDLSVIAQRLLMLNVATSFTFSMLVTHVLYHVAEKPELLQSLRDEIQSTISAKGGWTLDSMKHMWKLDSILRETLRYYGMTYTTLTRRAMTDVTLSDGTRLPEGTLLQAATYQQHHDDAYFTDAGTFDPFRFARMRDAEGQGFKHQASTTAPDYLAFGHGKHACPGRHFAAGIVKGVLVHLILNYDMKLGGTVRARRTSRLRRRSYPRLTVACLSGSAKGLCEASVGRKGGKRGLLRSLV